MSQVIVIGSSLAVAMSSALRKLNFYWLKFAVVTLGPRGAKRRDALQK